MSHSAKTDRCPNCKTPGLSKTVKVQKCYTCGATMLRVDGLLLITQQLQFGEEPARTIQPLDYYRTA